MGDMTLRDIAKIRRNNSCGWQNAKAEYDGVSCQPYNTIISRGKDIADVRQEMTKAFCFIQEHFKSAVMALTLDKFVIDYELRYSIDRDPYYGGPDYIGLSFGVEWKRRNVRATLVTGRLQKVGLHPDLRAIVDQGHATDLKKLTKLTGLRPEIVGHRHIDAGKALDVVKMLKVAAIGQNKLTRLVKGCLLFLDKLEHGSKKYPKFTVNTLDYTIKTLSNAMGYANTAYVFSSNQESPETNAILQAMCEEYPNPTFGGQEHIYIPADARTIWVVAYSTRNITTSVLITAETIWATLLQYCKQFSLGSELESALIIACSLRENRYLDKVSLPAVVSLCDLVYPVIVKPMDGLGDNTLLNLGASRVIGRFHQMLNLLIFKEIDTSFWNTSTNSGVSLDRDVRSAASMDCAALMNYLDDKCEAGLLKATRGLNWLPNLTDKHMDELRQISVFEAFWLVRNPKEVMKGGIIECLKGGYMHPIGLNLPGYCFDAYGTLQHEYKLGSKQDLSDICPGGYNIRASGFRYKLSVGREVVMNRKGKMAVEEFRFIHNGVAQSDPSRDHRVRREATREIEIHPNKESNSNKGSNSSKRISPNQKSNPNHTRLM